MKISNRTREQAALICQVAASNDLTFVSAASFLGMDWLDDACQLALRVHWNMRMRGGLCMSAQRQRLEAEALLRTGWSPE